MPRDADLPLTVPEPALALWLVEQALALGALLHVSGGEAQLARVRAAAEAFAGTRVEVLTLPPWDVLPYDRSAPSARVIGQRVRTLACLAEAAARPRLVLTTADAALQRVPPPGSWTGSELVLAVGDTLHIDRFRAGLAERGYHLDERIDEPGEVAIRGLTIEVFPAGEAAPVRLSLNADCRITAIHAYDPATQRSTGVLDRVPLRPAIEFPPDPDEAALAALAMAHPEDLSPEEAEAAAASPPRLVPLFEYLPGVAAVLDAEVEDRWRAFAEQVEDAYATTRKARRAQGEAGLLPRPSRLYVTPAQAIRALAGRVIRAEPEGISVEAPRRVEALAEAVRVAASRGGRVVIAVPAEPAAVAASLARHGLDARVATAWDEVAPGEAAVLRMDISEGLARPGLLVLSVAALLRARGSAAGLVAMEEAPRIGDLVVHLAHGVTRLTGLSSVEVEGQAEERAALAFADGAELLVPVNELDQVWRYGHEADGAALDRMGGEAWRRKRAEIEAEVAETARSLAAAAVARAAQRAPVIVPAQPETDRLARRFPYTPSPDQRAAIDAVLADFAAGRPMNRLVCGDVGFGKTEVALRAMAAAALAGCQVALAAPTSVLARQHLNAMCRRFAGTGMRVEGLRATTSSAGRAVLRGLASGEVRVVVGAQGIASEGVRFARLGLVVIDEEQRFGEADEARLAGLRQGDEAVHALAMTATPIPRTLQGALVGLRDVSVIATAPVRRQPTRTFVLPWDLPVAREALLREHRRGGQSFVVVPRIGDMNDMAAKLAEAVPELRVVQAHGRMRADALEEAVVGFSDGEGDVLLATNIIEAGLDIPRANTMLVLGAERFGLAQLHQLRGRVGRGQRRGSVYLMTDPGRRLAPATRQRLRTIEALSGLGAGVAISAADFDQRGAGDLFGEKRAGHVRTIGTELYQ